MTRFEGREADWLAPEEALARVLAAAPSPPAEEVPLHDALGRVLAEDVRAGATLPPWDNSAMDGYAVRGADLDGASPEHPVLLRVVGEVRAGELVEGLRVGRGEAVRIMTGGPVPAGADSVVRVEDTDAEAGSPGRVAVTAERDRSRNIRPAGEDVRQGDLLLPAGTPVGAGQVAGLAAAGRARVRVCGRPSVAVLCSGDELRDVTRFDEVARGRGVPDSNGPMLRAALEACGARPLPLAIAPDREEAIRRRVAEAGEADALVTVGGASMGEADLFKRVLDGMGFRLDFWRVRLRPGTPFGFGWLPRDGRSPLPVFGLPGNPGSAFVTFHLLVRPFLLRAAGRAHVHLPSSEVRAGEPLPGGGGSARVWRVRLEPSAGLPVARLAGPQGSGLVRSLAQAHALVVVPAGGAVREGERVRALLLGSGAAAGSASPFEARGP